MLEVSSTVLAVLSRYLSQLGLKLLLTYSQLLQLIAIVVPKLVAMATTLKHSMLAMSSSIFSVVYRNLNHAKN